jgi:hypothetical protein
MPVKNKKKLVVKQAELAWHKAKENMSLNDMYMIPSGFPIYVIHTVVTKSYNKKRHQA